MGKEHCFQLSKIPGANETHLPGKYVCKITGKTCIAAEYYDFDLGHPASTEVWSYRDSDARDCPAYNSTEEIADILKKNILILKKRSLEKEVIKIQGKIKDIGSEIS